MTDLINKYTTAIEIALQNYYCDAEDANSDWRHIHNIRRKLYKELCKVEKHLIALYENEPRPVYVHDDWTDACQAREEWCWEYRDVCERMYKLRAILGLKGMSAREWYHNHQNNKNNDKKNK